MTRSSLLLAVALTLPIAAPAAPQAVSNVQFARGASSSTVTGAIRGYQFRDYRVVVRAGQMLKVNMTRLRGSPYFNVLEPGQRDVAIFVGSTSGSDFEIRTSQNGAYTIRVYQMRASARRNETASYRLTIAAGGAPGGPVIEGAGRPSHPMAPAHHPGDALVRGTPYHAVAPVRCRTVMGGAFGTCKAGVIRRPNSATVHLDTPDGGERTINFRDGRAISSDAQAPFRVERRGDTSIIRIGAVEIYEIPDALPFGG